MLKQVNPEIFSSKSLQFTKELVTLEDVITALI